MKRLSMVVAVLALAVSASACGGSGKTDAASTPTTEDWANSVCSAISTWKTGVEAAGAKVSGGNLSKNNLTAAVSDVKSATQKFASTLSGLGRPSSASGKQASQEIEQLHATLSSQIDQIKKIPSEKSGLAAVSAVTGTLATMGSQISSTLSSLRSLAEQGDLRKAFKDAPACGKLT